MATSVHFTLAARKALDRQTWVTFRVTVPQACMPIIREAFNRAGAAEGVDPGICLERICADFLSGAP